MTKVIKIIFLKNRIKLLDLGSFPGGWSQVAKEKIKDGTILGVDKKKLDKINGVNFIIGDFLEANLRQKILNNFESDVDVILSDLAEKTTGNKSLDCIRTNQLCSEVLNFSRKVLSKNGVVVSKLFMGDDFEEVKLIARKNFKKINFFKPKSSRDESRETYIHCAGLNTL